MADRFFYDTKISNFAGKIALARQGPSESVSATHIRQGPVESASDVLDRHTSIDRFSLGRWRRRTMTRRAFLSSKSNTGAGEIPIKRACQKLWYLVQKNDDFSESMNSFDTGSIFLSPLGHDLSRDRSVVSVYAF